MTHTYVLTLNEMPRSSNRQPANRKLGHIEKKDWQGKFLAELMLARAQRHMTHVNVAITVRWKTKNHRDWHNWFHSIIKPLADALVQGGYLPDDTGDELSVETPFVFEYPAEWPERALHKVELIVKLEAEYEH